MKKGILCLLFIISVLYGCNSIEEYTTPIFTDKGILSGETIISDVICIKIIKMDVIDSLLILHCYNTLDKKHFCVYNKHSGKLLKTYGQEGNGPGELPNITDTLDKKTG